MADDSSDQIPEFYTDSAQLTTGAYGVSFTFSLNPPHPEQSKPVIAQPQCVLRMSLQQGKVIAMLLRQQLKSFERENGEISLPPGLYTGLGISREDWGPIE